MWAGGLRFAMNASSALRTRATSISLSAITVSPNAAVERRRDALSSAQQAQNEVARLLRASDWV
jgi:hypothetical protein